MRAELITFSLGLVILALTATQGFAAPWKEMSYSGLTVYELGEASTGQITLVCDPDNIQSSDHMPRGTKFYLVVTVNNRPLPDKSVTLETSLGYSGTFHAEGSSVYGSSNKPAWNTLIKALTEANQLTVMSGELQFTLDVTRKIELRCTLHD